VYTDRVAAERAPPRARRPPGPAPLPRGPHRKFVLAIAE